jgi:hypothetical protein
MAAEDKSLVLYFTFDDTGAPEDQSPNKSPIVSHVEPAELVEGIEGTTWLFDDSTCFLLDNPTLEAAFQDKCTCGFSGSGEEGGPVVLCPDYISGLQYW